MKGISSLIASVLLIAFTVSVSMIILGWFSSFAKSTTTNISSSATEAIGCNNAGVAIERIYVTGTNASIIVKNTGYRDLTISGMIVNTSGSSCSGSPTTLTKGNITSLELSGCYPSSMGDSSCSSFSRAIVTTNCGGVSDVVISTSYLTCSSN